MATRTHRETHEIEQTQKVIPFIFLETSFGQNVSELVFGVNVFDLNFGSKLILSRNQSRATLWVLDTCLIVGLRPSIIIFDHSFDVFKDVQQRFTLRRMCVGGYVIHLTQLLNLLSSFDMLGLGFGIKNCPSFLVACMFGLDLVVS